MAPRFSFVPARWLAPDSGLSPSDRLVLCALCLYVNRESGDCWPAINTLVNHTALSERTVRTSLRNLETFGAVETSERKNEAGQRTTNLYTVMGYDPVSRKQAKGAATIAPLPRQPATQGAATDSKNRGQPLPLNVVINNTEKSESSAGDPDGPPTSADIIPINRSRLDKVSDAEGERLLAELAAYRERAVRS